MPKSKYNALDICVTDYRDGWIEKLFRRFLKSNFCPPPPIQIEKNQEGAKRHIRTETQTSVTSLGELLDFGQLFKAFGNN